MQAENRGQSRSASLASLVGEGEPAVLLASKLSGAQVFFLIIRMVRGETIQGDKGFVLIKMMLSKEEKKKRKLCYIEFSFSVGLS